MKYRIFLIYFYFIIIKIGFAQNLIDLSQEYLRNRIEAAGIPPAILISNEYIYASKTLPLIYEYKGYIPIWFTDDGFTKQASDLYNQIQNADQHGLNPNDYHLERIKQALLSISKDDFRKKRVNHKNISDIDLLLTDAFLIYGSHLFTGRINPETIDPLWKANLREINIMEVLFKAINDNTVKESFEMLTPNDRGYHRMKNALKKYKEINVNGRWSVIPFSVILKKNDENETITLIKQRLFLTDDLHNNNNNSTLFDNDLEIAILKYKKRHGLEQTKIIDKKTIESMNITVEKRIKQLEINMERWLWLPDSLGENYIIVNIANYELEIYEKSNKVKAIKAIVGKGYRRTPIFSDEITYLVFSPYWYIPKNLIIQDIIPAYLKESDYFEKRNIKIFSGLGPDAVTIDPKTINWSAITEQNLRYRFRQDPGPQNSLGLTKFMFPNKYNVYIHDTPAKDLFSKPDRPFSSGCIRIEKPEELAFYLLKDDPGWDQQKILNAMNKSIEQTVILKKVIPVHLLYWTSWVDENNIVYFRKDIYGRDSVLEIAINQKPPQ